MAIARSLQPPRNLGPAFRYGYKTSDHAFWQAWKTHWGL